MEWRHFLKHIGMTYWYANRLLASQSPQVTKDFPFNNENQKLSSFHKIFNIFAWRSYRSRTLDALWKFSPVIWLICEFCARSASWQKKKIWSGIRRRWQKCLVASAETKSNNYMLKHSWAQIEHVPASGAGQLGFGSWLKPDSFLFRFDGIKFNWAYPGAGDWSPDRSIGANALATAADWTIHTFWKGVTTILIKRISRRSFFAFNKNGDQHGMLGNSSTDCTFHSAAS